MTRKTVLWLEFFHPYKHACELLWKSEHYFTSFFARLVHALHPDSTVAIKPKLKYLECQYSILRLVYPAIRDELLQAIDGSPPGYKASLQNLQLLFEFFLPVVSLLALLSFLICLRSKTMASRFDQALLLRSGPTSAASLLSMLF